MKKLSFFLVFFILLAVKSSKASTSSPITTVTSNLTIDQNWVNTHLGPWLISGSSITVTFGENFTISSSIQYFEITGSNVTINGDNHIVTIDGVANFNGLVDADNSNALSAEIKNIGVVTTNGTTLNGYAGYISANNNKAIINLCYSTGIISEYYSGGIVGANNSGTVKNCHSTGPILGDYLGGIAGIHNNTSIVNCYSSGTISGNQSGGISAYANYGQIKNCYSTGTISGNYSGGIFGSQEGNFGEISNCYSIGQITGTNSAGIVVNNKPTGKISNCYATGQITEINSAGIYSSNDDGLIINTLHTSSGWNNTYANSVLIGVGKIWNNTVFPYQLTLITTLPSIVLASPIGTLTSCLNSSSTNPITFVVTGADLTESLTISAPSGFEISTTSGGSYSSSLTLTNTSTVSETLYVRLNSSATEGSKSGTITATSTDASDATTTVSVTVYELPVITISGTTTDIDLVSLTTSGGTTYAWSDGSSITSTTNTFDASGLYALTVTDANGCISSTLLNIKVQYWGLSSSGAKTLDSAIQINRFGKIGSLNPITASGKISEYKQNNNGLVLNLDAGNSSSYSGTGNIWSDLSGNGINATFGLGNQSPTYSENNGGTFIFSSADQQYLTFNQSDLHKLPYGNTPFTMSAWAKSIKTSDNGWGWIIAYGKDAAGSTARFIGSGEGSYSFGGYNFDDVIGDPIPLNEWFNITGTFDGLNAILYVNGIEMQRAEKPNWDAIEDVGYIGNQVNLQNEYWDGAISNIQIYNKALTATEVLNNYNNLKSRFSLGNVAIGTQIWTNKNLDVTTYRDGTIIPQVSDPSAWAGLTTGAWCYYNNDPANGAIYGKLYNMYAVKDSRGLAPQGWHIPTDAEWTTLGILLGGDAAAGGKMKTTGITRWTTPNTSATNESGFTGLPGGYRYNNGTFDRIGNAGFWWSTTQYDANALYLRRLDYNNGSLIIDINTLDMHGGFSVRLIKD